MSEIDIDLLRKDECQPYTDEQITDIKSQFHPSNTANVNIVPYHIYDEDEHVVGEWRETIDGVKKKKPVYERMMYKSQANSPTSGTSTETDGGLVSNDMDNDRAFIAFSRAQDSAGASIILQIETSFDPSTKRYVKTLLRDKHFYIGNSTGRAINNIYAFVRYTKTTDEWEPV